MIVSSGNDCHLVWKNATNRVEHGAMATDQPDVTHGSRRSEHINFPNVPIRPRRSPLEGEQEAVGAVQGSKSG